MSCSMSQIQSFKLSATDSLFPEVEDLLEENNGFYRKAILKIAYKKNIDYYESFMDFLFCELYPRDKHNWKYKCQQYYKGRENFPMLREYEVMTPELIDEYQYDMINKVFPTALSYLILNMPFRNLSWATFIDYLTFYKIMRNDKDKIETMFDCIAGLHFL